MLLLNAGADVNAVIKQTQTGEPNAIMSRAITPLVVAAGNGEWKVVCSAEIFIVFLGVVGGKATVRLLLEWGASDTDGDAIQAAQQAGHDDIVEIIISSQGIEEDRDVTQEEKKRLEQKVGVAKTRYDIVRQTDRHIVLFF